jgi:hypothetical protein
MESIMRKILTVTLAALAALALGACERRLDTSKQEAPERLAAAGSAGNLIGTPPAPPTRPEGAAPETTPVPTEEQLTGQPKLAETPRTTGAADASKELTQAEESRAMPLPGQPNDHSNVAPDASQRAGQSDPQQAPERSGESNAPQRGIQAAPQTQERT